MKKMHISIYFIFLFLQIIEAFTIKTNFTRIRRQTYCGFKCKKSGECIDEDKECDGIVDCKDGTDETNACHRFNCPKYLFRCDYGACINPDKECDGKQDCKDNSDETSLRCKKTGISTCDNEQFQCQSGGQCIPEDNKCDGVADCMDKSDETADECFKYNCPGYTYRCAYGACVNGNSKCNGLTECLDGSDEANCPTPKPPPTDPPIINTETPPTPTPGTVPDGYCILPNHPENGHWSIWGGQSSLKPGDPASPGTVLTVQCNKRFKPIGESLILCSEGRWSNSVAQCSILCPPLLSTKTTTVTCTYRGIPANCSEPRSGTIAKFTCAPFYEDLQLARTPTRICEDGSWDLEKPNCIPACGKKSVSATTLIVGSTKAKKGDYPWQVALYRLKKSEKEFICGGSLINQRVILTAAHCVSDLKGNQYPVKNYMVAVGKYYRLFDDPNDKDAQSSKVKNIYLAEQYKGENQNFLGDIAILVTEKIFTLSKRVQAVCVDWGLIHEHQLTQAGIKGIVTGWGYTEAQGNLSNELKELEVPFIQYNQCAQELPTDYDNYLTYDKLCSGYLNKSIGVCKGDSGGGLVSKNLYDGRYYITGIVSISPMDEGSCDIQQYALYTKVSTYIPFIFEKERTFRP